MSRRLILPPLLGLSLLVDDDGGDLSLHAASALVLITTPLILTIILRGAFPHSWKTQGRSSSSGNMRLRIQEKRMAS